MRTGSPGPRSRRTGPLRVLAAFAVTLLAATACTSGGRGGADGRVPVRATTPATYHQGTLRVLASSELSDMAKILTDARKATGVDVKMTYSGTLDAAELVADGGADGRYDAIWLSSNDYLRLLPGTGPKITDETPVMSSPVAIGVRAEDAGLLGRPASDVTWSDVYDAVTRRGLTYGMTDPARSNSGYAALISVTSALSDAQSALTQADVDRTSAKLTSFFSGQKLTSGSSGWLASAYRRDGSVNAMINYESVLTELNRTEHAGLSVIRPKDGVVTANYPFTLLTSAPQDARTSADALTGYLRTPAVQERISRQTYRRPVVPAAAPAPGLGTDKRRELPFPGSLAVAGGLLDAYENKLRRPSRTVYVLDTSGSMAGDRLARLKRALIGLTGSGTGGGGAGGGGASGDGAGGADDGFRDREQVTLMPFGTTVKQVTTRTVAPADPTASLAVLRSDIGRLTASGNTAVYDSLEAAYAHLGPGSANTFTSIVLMTDGESNAGSPAGRFDTFYAGLPAAGRSTPVFPVVFGDADRAELQHIAALTGGRLFDATGGDAALDGAFEEIRGYQ
ncbi:substrate-binding and vWA domain-containing protein [Streptomyces sp. NBC_01497]|uniref:substrate-binding and vWA domain-containing protein n=1 Tax=Streptomyces sp. NBC_01497 TaxID=2903885 RepID=UPI002E32E16E|nr:VWA domain-containing protein [Streptomyces sp. NBC_01497]